MSLDPRITAAVLQTRCSDYMNPESECDGPDGCAECCEAIARAVLTAAVDALPIVWIGDGDNYVEVDSASVRSHDLLRALTGDDGGGA